MTVGFKDSAEVVEFRRLFARLKDWSEDDPGGLPELAHADKGIEELSLSLLRVAGSIQKRERLQRDLFTGPVDPRFISEWRDFEERFASVLLSIRFNTAATADRDFLFSFDFYEEPDQWKMADYKAIMCVKSLEMTMRFARVRAEQIIEAAGPKLDWRALNIKAAGPELRQAYAQMVDAALEYEGSLDELRNTIHDELTSSPDEARKSELRDWLFRIEIEHDHEEPIEHVARDGWTFWEALKRESGLDLRGILRRRALVPFVLFPRHVSARLSSTDLPSIYQSLREAHEAFVFGLHFAALALMRSVMEMTLRDHYGATGRDLNELIDSVANRLPRRANAVALHRLRKLANLVLHGKSDVIANSARTENRDLERNIVSLFFALRALVEGAPLLRER
jgi:hypothetical protein